ncbi:transposable element Tcb1 transposase [Trichonephila clavipes]|nr:transposable element Tcb1 transposase [Trichonephila clavipes]
MTDFSARLHNTFADHLIDLQIYWEIGSRVGRNQTNVMRICDRWMQECTTDQRDRSHPPKCTTSLSSRIIRRRFTTEWSIRKTSIAWSTLDAEPQTSLRRQWCDERRMWDEEWNEVVFTDESRICLQHHDGWIRVWNTVERGC